MKKILSVCAVCFILAAGTTACNKKCECKTYVAGTVVATTEVERDSGEKCSDMNTVVEVAGSKTGIECTRF